MNKHIEAEEQAQASFWFTYKAGNFFVFLLWVVLLYNDHFVTVFFGLVAQVVFNLIRYPQIEAKFEQRLKTVTFKTQIENLYVFSTFEGQEDATVAATFQKTIDWLKKSGNPHEVRVHMVIFQDVKTFVWFIDRNGKLVKNSDWREPGSSNETWEQYLAFIDQYQAEQNDKRRRELRKDGAAYDWVNENVFNQWGPENS